MLSGRQLLVIGLASGLWAFSFGVGMQVISHWLATTHQATNAMIGWVQGSYYLGLAVASLAAPALTRRWGERCAALGMVAAGASLAVFPGADSPMGWLVLRGLSGMAGALSVIPLEALVSRASPPLQRARNLGVYGAAMALGATLGTGAGLYLMDQHSLAGQIFGNQAALAAFIIGGAAGLLGGGLVWLGVGKQASAEPADAKPAKLFWRRNLLSFGTAWALGFLEGVMLVFLALYLVASGFSQTEAAMLVAITLVGVILFQVPVGWVADRLGNTPVLLGCYAVVLASLVVIPWLQAFPLFMTWLLFFGACAGAMYPLGLALLGEEVAEPVLPRAYAWFLAVECLGTVAGATIAGLARDWAGEAAMFSVSFIAVAAVLVGWMVVGRKGNPSLSTSSLDASDDRQAA